MTKTQDENIYHRILELPKEVTRPDHYQLLGLRPLENDPKKIKTAAMDRNALLQRMQNAENYEDVKRLEREVGEAMVCLANPQRKAEYDQKLTQTVAIMEAPPKPPSPPVQDTQSIRNSNVSTAEVKVAPPPPPPAPEPEKKPAPKPGVQFLPPPVGKPKDKAKAERHPQRESKKFLPGEAPWQLAPDLKKRFVMLGAGLVLLIILVIIIWPSSKPNETIAEEDEPTKPSSTRQQETPAAVSKVIGPANVNLLASQVVFKDKSGTLEDFAMAPDASWMATLNSQGLIDLWDASLGSSRVLNSNPATQGGTAKHIAATPDGGHLFVASTTGQLEEWPITLPLPAPGTITPQSHISHAFASGVCALEVTPDGNHVFGSSANSELFVFERNSTATTVRDFNFEDVKPLNLLAASPTAQSIAVCFADQSIRAWDPSRPTDPPEILIPSQGLKPDLAMAYSVDGAHLAAVGGDHQIRLMDAGNPQAELILCKGHTDRVYALSFSQDGSLLVSAGADRAVRLWDTSTGAEVATLGGHVRPIVAVQFAKDGESFLTASQDGMVRKWQVQESAGEPAPILPAEVIAGSANPNAISETAASRLATAHRFQMADTTSQPFDAILRPLTWAAISPDGTHVAGPTAQDKVVIQDTKSTRPKHVLPIIARTPGMVQFSADGQTLIAVQDDGWMSTWDVPTGRLLDRIVCSQGIGSPQFLAVSTAGQRFAVPRQPNVEIRTKLEDLSSQPESVNLSQNCYQFALSADGRFLATNSGTVIEAWDLGDPANAVNPRLLKSFPFQEYSIQRTFTFSPDGSLCAVGNESGKIYVLSIGTGKELASFTGHPYSVVKSLAFDSKGSLLFSAGTDNGVRVWSTKTWSLIASLPAVAGPGMASSAPGQLVPPASLGGPVNLPVGTTNDPPVKLQLTTDGKQLVVVHQSGQGIVWEVGSRDNPAIAADYAPADLMVSGSTQVLTFKNFSALVKWTEFLAHPQTVTHLDFTPDGKFLLTAGTDGIVRVWNAQTGSLQRQILLAPATGKTPAGARIPGGVQVQGIPDVFGQPMGAPETLGGPQNWAISADNLLAASMDGRVVQLWDITKGVKRGVIGDPKEDHVWFGFSPDGKTFLTLFATGFLKSWNVSDLALLSSTPMPAATVFASAPSGSGFWLALGDANGAVSIVKNDGTTFPLSATGVPLPVGRLRFSKDGALLAVADTPGTIRAFDINTRSEVMNAGLHGQFNSDMEFTPDGKGLLTLLPTGMLSALTVDPANRRSNRLVPVGPSGLAETAMDPNDPNTVLNRSKQVEGTLLAISPDGKTLAIAGGTDSYLPAERGKVAFWGVGDKPSALSGQSLAQQSQGTTTANPQAITRSNLDQIKPLASIQGHKSVQTVAFCPDGQAFVSGGSDQVVTVWNPYADPIAEIHALKGHAYPVLAVAASKTLIATADSKGFIKIWDRQTGEELLPDIKKAQHTGGVQDLAFSPNEQYLGSAGQDKQVKIWHPATLTEVAKLQAKHKATVTGLTWVDDNTILSCDSGNRIIHWPNPLLGGGLTRPIFVNPLLPGAALKSGGLETEGFGGRINAIASGPSQMAAFATENKLVGLWNGNNGKDETPHRLKAHTQAVKCLAFSPDGSLVASAGGDNAILFWSTSGTGSLIHTLPIPVEMGGTADQIQAMEFSPDGRWLLTGDAGGYLKLWGVP